MGKLLILIFGAAVIVLAFSLHKPETRDAGNTSPGYTVVPDRASDKLSLVDEKWSRGGFGTVAIASFKIKNDNTYAVKDVQIFCSFLGKSGTEISSKSTTIYEVAAPGASVAVRNLEIAFVDKQVQQAACHVQSAQRAYQ